MQTVFADLNIALRHLPKYVAEKNIPCCVYRIGYGSPRKYEYSLRPLCDVVDPASENVMQTARPKQNKELVFKEQFIHL